MFCGVMAKGCSLVAGKASVMSGMNWGVFGRILVSVGNSAVSGGGGVERVCVRGCMSLGAMVSGMVWRV